MSSVQCFQQCASRERAASLTSHLSAVSGDPIEAGAAFRAIAERTGYLELTGIRRQQAEWQREASRDFARANTVAALDRYQQHGAIRFAATRQEAKDHLVRDLEQPADSATREK